MACSNNGTTSEADLALWLKKSGLTRGYEELLQNLLESGTVRSRDDLLEYSAKHFERFGSRWNSGILNASHASPMSEAPQLDKAIEKQLKTRTLACKRVMKEIDHNINEKKDISQQLDQMRLDVSVDPGDLEAQEDMLAVAELALTDSNSRLQSYFEELIALMVKVPKDDTISSKPVVQQATEMMKQIKSRLLS